MVGKKLKGIVALSVALPLLLLSTLQSSSAEDVRTSVTNQFQKLTFSDSKYPSHIMPYRLFKPEDYSSRKSYPLVIFLHGSGEGGTDNTAQLNYPVGALGWAWPDKQAQTPCFVLAPQHPEGQLWADINWSDFFSDRGKNTDIKQGKLSENEEMVFDLVKFLESEYSINTNKIILTGFSDGGFATWDMLEYHPEIFSAAIPMCGGGDISKADLIKNIPIWDYHGNTDDSVNVNLSRKMIMAIREAGGNPRYREVNKGTHMDYTNDNAIAWAMKQTLKTGVETLPQTDFSDVPQSSWFYGSVRELAERGLINGYPDKTFKPNSTITIAEFLALTLKSIGYTDIPNDKSNWASNYIDKAATIGLIDNNQFANYNKAIIRGQMASIIVRVITEEYSYSTSDIAARIKDYSKMSSSLKTDVVKVYSKGILAGCPDGEFKPDKNTTRAEACAVITRFVKPSARLISSKEE